jgi:hypothetical protein
MNKIGKIATYVSTVLGVVVLLVTSVIGVYSFITHNAIEKDREILKNKSIEKKVDNLTTSDSIFAIQFEKMLENQIEVLKKVDVNIKWMKSINTGFTNHLKSTQRMEELIQYYESQQMLKKVPVLNTDSLKIKPSPNQILHTSI